MVFDLLHLLVKFLPFELHDVIHLYRYEGLDEGGSGRGCIKNHLSLNF